ncbi:ABC transporter permease [Trichocoleus sp. FACHB-90]|jgi:putative ABC transport system permease protein|uniref:ABC transporter permease n=1 Tax=Cyanophyceae TaxID=3028117 RepID=UPI0016826F06|nr:MULTISPECIES: ABC transporter permease [unclassified Trichocoleus]MBD1929003.1 ABC transporter permease [Trichocoleus sp. FACHB-90]MBD1934271.1 ABC transporter permease [Trichocoleus sp. FACHB-69]
MDILESVKMAATTLVANKLRSSLTMLGIMIGNASVIAMVGIGQGAQRLASEQFEALGPNVLFVVPGSQATRNTTLEVPKTLVLEDARAIATQVPSVKEVAPQINTRQLVTYRNKNTNATILGTTSDYLSVRSFDVETGRFITEQDIKRSNQVVMLGPELAKKLFDNQNPIGEQLRIKNLSFQVVGIMKPKGSALGDNPDETVYVPITTVANRIVGRTSPYGLEITAISLSAKDEDSTGAAKFQVENLLRLRHKINGEDDFTVRSQKDLLTIVNTITSGLTLMLAAIAAISLFVGGIGVMNIMLVSVTERTQEIGLRKAIGAQEQDILIQFIIEAVILSAAGGLFGTMLGVGGISLVSAFSPLKASISPVAVIVAVSVSGGIGLFFGVVPARRAAKLDPIVALRSA